MGLDSSLFECDSTHTTLNLLCLAALKVLYLQQMLKKTHPLCCCCNVVCFSLADNKSPTLALKPDGSFLFICVKWQQWTADFNGGLEYSMSKFQVRPFLPIFYKHTEGNPLKVASQHHSTMRPDEFMQEPVGRSLPTDFRSVNLWKSSPIILKMTIPRD